VLIDVMFTYHVTSRELLIDLRSPYFDPYSA
jgi:hypothetical protein